MDATETTIYYAIVLCALVIFFFIAVFVCSSIWLQRRFRQTAQQAIEATVVTMEAERSRVAADLHDEAGPLIYGILRKIEMASTSNGDGAIFLDAGRDQLIELDQKLKEISHALVPLSLERKGLLYCVKEMITGVHTNHSLRVELRCNDLPAMSKVSETHLYRILQEIVLNTLKHSGATRLIIEMRTTKNVFIIRTSDNGNGMANEPKPNNRIGAGIHNIKSRARFLNGVAQMKFEGGCKWEVRVSGGL